MGRDVIEVDVVLTDVVEVMLEVKLEVMLVASELVTLEVGDEGGGPDAKCWVTTCTTAVRAGLTTTAVKSTGWTRNRSPGITKETVGNATRRALSSHVD